jgi:hypothetical protein
MNVLLEISDDGTLQLRRRHGNDIESLKKTVSAKRAGKIALTELLNKLFS